MAERCKVCICENCGSEADTVSIRSWSDETEKNLEAVDKKSGKTDRCLSCGHTAEVTTDGGWSLEDLVKYHIMSEGSERTSMQKHVIICPFCDVGRPVPSDFDAIHRCNCGACYKVCGNDSLETGVSNIANELWTDGELDFIRSVPIDFCNIVIEKDFDRLLDLKQNLDPNGLERFCKYDMDIHLSLVWVKRLF